MGFIQRARGNEVTRPGRRRKRHRLAAHKSPPLPYRPATPACPHFGGSGGFFSCPARARGSCLRAGLQARAPRGQAALPATRRTRQKAGRRGTAAGLETGPSFRTGLEARAKRVTTRTGGPRPVVSRQARAGGRPAPGVAVSRPIAPLPKPEGPISEPKSPTSGPKSPVSGLKLPTSGLKSPVSDPKSPTSRPKSPTLRPKLPISGPKLTLSGLKSPTFATETAVL